MTRIGNAEQVLLLLQDQLDRLRKTRDREMGRTSAIRGATPAPLDRVRAMAARSGMSDEEMKRALVRGLLVQQFGEAIGNDPAFETVAADVTRIIGDSEQGRAVLDRALAALADGVD